MQNKVFEILKIFFNSLYIVVNLRLKIIIIMRKNIKQSNIIPICSVHTNLTKKLKHIEKRR